MPGLPRSAIAEQRTRTRQHVLVDRHATPCSLPHVGAALPWPALLQKSLEQQQEATQVAHMLAQLQLAAGDAKGEAPSSPGSCSPAPDRLLRTGCIHVACSAVLLTRRRPGYGAAAARAGTR